MIIESAISQATAISANTARQRPQMKAKIALENVIGPDMGLNEPAIESDY